MMGGYYLIQYLDLIWLNPSRALNCDRCYPSSQTYNLPPRHRRQHFLAAVQGQEMNSGQCYEIRAECRFLRQKHLITGITLSRVLCLLY